jgi:hypothetical protein
MPVTWALAGPKLDEREVLAAMLDAEPQLAAARPGLLLIADKGFRATWFETSLDRRGIKLLRPSMRNEQPRPGEQLLKPVRQLIESVNDTLKGRTFGGVAVRVAQRILAMAAAIWHNHRTGQPVTRSLTAYDH